MDRTYSEARTNLENEGFDDLHSKVVESYWLQRFFLIFLLSAIIRKGEKLPEQFVSTFDFLKATKRTYRFEEYGTDPDLPIKTLYVKQTAFKAQPKKLKVTVEVIE
mgnify:CR=1 FL=1